MAAEILGWRSGTAMHEAIEAHLTSEYVPVAGDVVELSRSWGGLKRCKAVVFGVKGGLCVVYFDGEWDHFKFVKGEIKSKVDHLDVMDGVRELKVARKIAEEYFSKPEAEYVPAVGDVVEILNNRGGAPESTIGTKSKVSSIYNGGAILASKWSYSNGSLKLLERPTPQPEFTGTYAERQAQWVEHHGLKVGDKVKVVRKFESSEDGVCSGAWSYVPDKATMQQQDVEIVYIGYGYINLRSPKGSVWSFPYFVLEPVAESTEKFPELRPRGQRNLRNYQIFIATKSHRAKEAYQIVMYCDDKFYNTVGNTGVQEIKSGVSNLLISKIIDEVKTPMSSDTMRRVEADFKKKWPHKKLYVN